MHMLWKKDYGESKYQHTGNKPLAQISKLQ